ncbi:hypothetical protein KU74_08065 [Pectobacterium brasiliense]|uniref:Uncharacterized protein n=1 Tax=Pectobacterium brasiliense TaxID=180957 RepID=A0A0M2F7R6_9GAMM|nr:hypothetical protein KU74_08065 [Pectobacterium brasiliense]
MVLKFSQQITIYYVKRHLKEQKLHILMDSQDQDRLFLILPVYQKMIYRLDGYDSGNYMVQ